MKRTIYKLPKDSNYFLHMIGNINTRWEQQTRQKSEVKSSKEWELLAIAFSLQ